MTLRYRLAVGEEVIELDTGDSDDQVPGLVNFLMSLSVPAAVFASYLLGESTEHLINAVSDGTVIRRGDVVRIETGGGGGYDHPYDREPERVLADVRAGFVGAASAERDYGVVLGSTSMWISQQPRAAASAARTLPRRPGLRGGWIKAVRASQPRAVIRGSRFDLDVDIAARTTGPASATATILAPPSRAPPTRRSSIPATRCMSARAARPTRSVRSTRRSSASTA